MAWGKISDLISNGNLKEKLPESYMLGNFKVWSITFLWDCKQLGRKRWPDFRSYNDIIWHILRFQIDHVSSNFHPFCVISTLCSLTWIYLKQWCAVCKNELFLRAKKCPIFQKIWPLLTHQMPLFCIYLITKWLYSTEKNKNKKPKTNGLTSLPLPNILSSTSPSPITCKRLSKYFWSLIKISRFL